MVNVPGRYFDMVNGSGLKAIAQCVSIYLVCTLFTSCGPINDVPEEGTYRFKIYPNTNEKHGRYALVDEAHSSIYPCSQTFNLPDESASYEGYYFNGTPNENGSIFQISTFGNDDTRRGHEPIRDKEVKIYTNPITSHLSFIVEDPSIKVEKMIALTPDSVYLTNLDPADKDLTLEIPANKLNEGINVLAKSKQSLNFYVNKGNEPYLLKAKLEEGQLEPGKEYTIYIDFNNTGEPYMYLVSSGDTRVTSSHIIPEQEAIKNPGIYEKFFGKDDVRTDDVRTDDVMRNTNDENFSTNYIWNGDGKNGNTDL